MEIILILLLLAVVTALISAKLLKAAANYKRTYGKSLWPGILAICAAVDLLFSVFYSRQQDMFLPVLIAAILLLAYAVFRTTRYYPDKVLGALGVQLAFSVLQLGFFVMILLAVGVSKLRKQQNTVLGMLRSLFSI